MGFSQEYYGGVSASKSCAYTADGLSLSGPFTSEHCTKTLSCFSDVSTCEVPNMYWIMKDFGPLAGFPCGSVGSDGKYTMVCNGGPNGDGKASQCVERSSIASPEPTSPPPPPPPPNPLPSSPPPPPEVSCEGKEDGTPCMMNGGDKGACWKSSCSNRQKSCIHAGTTGFSQEYYGGVSASASCDYTTTEGISGPINLAGNPEFTADHCTKTLACFSNDKTCADPKDYWIMTGFGALAGFPCGPLVDGKYTKVCNGGPNGDGKGSQCVPTSSTITSLPPPPPPPPPNPPPPTGTTPTPSLSPDPPSGTYPADPPADVTWQYQEWTATVTTIEVGQRS